MQLDTYPYKILFVCVCVFGNLGCGRYLESHVDIHNKTGQRNSTSLHIETLSSYLATFESESYKVLFNGALRVSRIKDLLNIKNGAKILAPVTAIGGKTLR